MFRSHKVHTAAVLCLILSVVFVFGSVSVFASSEVLKKGMQGSEVTALQKDLIKLGYLDTDPSGYFGDATEAAVKNMQKEYGYDPDGIAGETTLALLNRLLGRSQGTQKPEVSSGSKDSNPSVLKEGIESSAVLELQKNLKKLGFLAVTPTGYFGEATAAAVKKLQKKYGYEPDGVAGPSTLALIKKLAANAGSSTGSSTGKTETKQSSYMLSWFSKASKIFKTGDIATVYDIKSGLSFKVKRTYGHNHADCEALTAKDTAIMKKIFGGSWTWSRRSVIVKVDGMRIAASMAGMPHAGLDKYAANRYISSRSGGFGRGENLDAVKGNNMNGHFDIHFYGSRTHGTNRVDSAHQRMVKAAATWAKNHY